MLFVALLDLERFVEPLKHYSEEHFVSFHLDKNNKVTGYHIAAQGSIAESVVHPREIFKAALLSNSFGIIVAHNHPSGSLKPSDEDIHATKQLIKAGNLIGIVLWDHVIVSSEGIYSLRAAQSDLWLNNDTPAGNKDDSNTVGNA